MKFLPIAILFGCSVAQNLKIPSRVGNVVALSKPSVIPKGKTVNLGNKEFDRGMACKDGDTGSDNAVFILEDGATIEDVIIGPKQLEGIHCKGKCTIRRAWFRDICEDAISILGTGNALIEGGGAQNGEDKVIQHNGAGTVTIKDYTVDNVGKVYRSCGNCSNNKSKSPRKVIITNLRATNVKTNIAGINSNYGDQATISGSCGTNKGDVCQEFAGKEKSEGGGDSKKLTTKGSCLGAQGKLITLPRC
ncbi:polysaccharide lyase family 3 protein [Aaosphaeria arxii CBS 175.79]|uniref:Pectate lyase n=1 Tax=Aaosphaeria arxii CBS 175.79 TaxID=1450172 RepID=A0A6A5X8W4_9PLEO|nr:polysaccharide lyase family 3 protein [Aaosphaeria arxii CBS 175.79]KAF2009363.1 polysaccharide lyase family 3 protein [Aaosphaeria arxii CBS 175.79]